MTFGTKLKVLRAERAMTQEDMAHALGITRRAYVAYERGEAKPRKYRYQQLADILGCDIEELTMPAADDKVSHPSHYVEGRRYEPKDVIRDWGLNYNLGCVVKYISRAGRKDDILQDLRKAKQYLEFEIEAIEKEKE